MLKFIYATIITAIVSGVFLTFFPVLLAEELTLAKVLFYVIAIVFPLCVVYYCPIHPTQ